MMKSIWKILVPLVLLAVVAGGFAWFSSSSHMKHTEAGDHEPLTRIRSVEGAPRGTSFSIAPTMKLDGEYTAKPKARRANSSSARQNFVDTSVPLDERFSRLVALAEGGDEAAAHFALQIANQCNSVSQVPIDQPPLGHTRATRYQIQLRQETQSECAAVLYAPKFSDLKSWLKVHPVDALDAPVRAAIRRRYTDKGANAALSAAVGVIMARPDETTAMTVANQLADLDISSIYSTQSQIEFMASMKPPQRNILMRYALGLLACDYGRPCGPDSFAVRSTCFSLGACVPDADLQTVYEKQLLGKQQVKGVRTLLAYLRQLHGTMVTR